VPTLPERNSVVGGHAEPVIGRHSRDPLALICPPYASR
jgi:hypothetical protein